MLRTRVAVILSVIAVLSIPFILAANPVAVGAPFQRVDARISGLTAASGTALDEAAIFDTIYYACPNSGDTGQDTDQLVTGLDFCAQGSPSNCESVLSLGEDMTTCSSQAPCAPEMHDPSPRVSATNSDVATGTPANQDVDTDNSDDSDSSSSGDPSLSSNISNVTCSGTFPEIQTPSIQESVIVSFSSHGSSSDRTNRR